MHTAKAGMAWGVSTPHVFYSRNVSKNTYPEMNIVQIRANELDFLSRASIRKQAASYQLHREPEIYRLHVFLTSLRLAKNTCALSEFVNFFFFATISAQKPLKPKDKYAIIQKSMRLR